MTKKQSNLSVIKSITPSVSSEDMIKDIQRLYEENIGLETKCRDMFLIYVTEDGRLSYLGQTLVLTSPLEMIGSLEIIKNTVILESCNYAVT